MSVISKEDLKEKFEQGDRPTQADFGDLIDSCYNREVVYLTQTEYDALVATGTVKPNVEYNVFE